MPAILALALLLLLSPCKVRNFVQVELGIPKTEASNKSKGTVNPLDCVVVESTAYQTNHYEPIPRIPALPAGRVVIREIPDLTPPAQLAAAGENTAEELPLYILYHRFQVYA